MRKPRLIWTWPRSSTQGTRKRMTRSGSMIRSTTFAWRYSACRWRTMASVSATSWTAWWNSGSAGFFAFTSAIRDETKEFMASPPTETCQARRPAAMAGLSQASGSIVVRRPARGNSRRAVHVSMDRAFEGGVPVTKFLLWLVLLILCWPLALLALLLYPLVWLPLLPFPLIGVGGDV